MKNPPEYRIRVDLDGHGNPIGWSYEVLDSDQDVVATVVGPRPDPFDSPIDALAHALAHVGSRYGVWVPLF